MESLLMVPREESFFESVFETGFMIADRWRGIRSVFADGSMIGWRMNLADFLA